MNWNIKDHGDSIEKLAAKKLADSIISKYNTFWATYIGCENGLPIQIKNITEEQNRIRLLLGQWNYTLLFNLLILEPNNSSFGTIKKNEYNKVVQSIQKYNGMVHTFYNSIEIIKKFNEYFKSHNIDISQYKTFVEYRNIIAHNIRPFIKIDSVVRYPLNYDVFENLDKNFVWSLDSSPQIKYQTIEEFKGYAFSHTQNLLFNLIDKANEILSSKLKGEKILEIGSVTNLHNSTFVINTPTSGSTYNS